MKKTDFALFGAAPAFDTPLSIGQHYSPSWERYEAAFRGIFERQYYNNNGPLLSNLEERLQEFMGVKHAICVSNATLGLMIVAEALALSGKVILPAFASIASAQSLTRSNLEPVFCDVDIDTHQIAIDQIDALINKDVSAIMAVNLWGGTCNQVALAELADAHGIELYFDSAHGFGCAVDGILIGNFGRAEVFSFHASQILNATEGGCICTNDDDLAAHIRSIRPSYGPEKPVSVVKVANARMSEAQAAMALLSLEDFADNQVNNERQYRLYENLLAEIPGLYLVRPTGVSFSNFQCVACQINEHQFGLARDTLVKLLKAENVIARRSYYPALHHGLSSADNRRYDQNLLPVTDNLCTTTMELPIGALVTMPDIEKICRILLGAHHASTEISSHYE